ncbi:hypothetical protein [Bacillus thuringiensis]|uniref:hypothetical protein n=1 Tax=Bacillus thuringiensis TaxID=1428 RepID=UPI0021D69653|nr:hypothetical protein [Bacillus thuringiensis]MCU7667701.1 hypothetical protein [Bacillus thuringiensis]
MNDVKPVSVAIVNVGSGNWSGTYVDGELFLQGHSLSENDFCKLISKYRYFHPHIEKIELTDGQIEELDFSLPGNLNDVRNVL